MGGDPSAAARRLSELEAYARGRDEGRAESAARIVALEAVIAAQRETELAKDVARLNRQCAALERKLHAE